VAQPAKLLRKPNLLVFLPDEQRADTIACYGGAKVHAPNLNKLASQSFVFQQAYVTHPLCTPSRSSLMTGTWPHSNGCTHNDIRLDTHFRCLPELIGDNDYYYAYMGKWHLGDEVFTQHGFEDWVSIEDSYRAFSAGRDPNAMSHYNKFLVSKGLKPDNKKKRGVFTNRFSTRLPFELSKSKFLETSACEFLGRHRREPFVLFVAFHEPHPPYNGPFNSEHSLKQISLDPTVDHVFSENMPLRYRLRQEYEQSGRSRDDYLKTKQKYLGLVTEIDQCIGAILLKLQELGLADNTIVVHTSDHGDMMSAHGLFGKEVLFQEAVRVPYLVRLPNQRRLGSVSQPVSHIDFAPTIIDLLGKPPHEQCVGKSRAPLIRGETMPAETVFLQWAPNNRLEMKKGSTLAKPDEIQRALNESTRAAISSDGWKLCLRDADKNELYNLRSDPGELQNLYDRADHKDLITRLTNEIHHWQEAVGDTLKV
jgi:arylsulfatase A-like enzyme